MTDKHEEKAKKEREAELAQASAQIMKHQAEQQSGKKGSDTEEIPVGVDIGTSKIVLCEKKKDQLQFSSQLNGFIPVDYSRFTEGILKQNRINYFGMDDQLLVYGEGAEVFASMMNLPMRRPMRSGMLNPKEPHSIDIIKQILNNLVASAANPTKLCFSIPGALKGSESDIIYHEAILKRHLSERGYESQSINEGLAVVLAELEDQNFTGMGISAGGGMCNVCLAYLSIPLISFSINKGGDYIDDAVASVTNEVNTRVRAIKENDLDLKKKPRNDVEDALHIYYDDLIWSLVQTVKKEFAKTSKLPQVDKPIQIVLSGGTVKPNGFREKFEACLKKESFPLAVSEIRLAEDPLLATAKGAFIAAMSEQ